MKTLIFLLMLASCGSQVKNNQSEEDFILYFGHGSISVDGYNQEKEHIDALPINAQSVHLSDDKAFYYPNPKDATNVSWHLFSGERIDPSIYNKVVQDGAKTLQKYFPIQFNAGDFRFFDWTDDTLWDITMANLKDLSEFLAKNGYQGIILEPEEYGNTGASPDNYPGTNSFWTWSRSAVPTFSPVLEPHMSGQGKTYPQVSKAVRSRGMDFLRVFENALPNLSILMAYGPSHIGFDETLNRSEMVNGLYAEFLDGMLEASRKDSTIFVDLCEGNFSSSRWEGYVDIVFNDYVALTTVDPEIYKNKIRIGFAIFRNRHDPESFKESIELALSLSKKNNPDKLGRVWIYDEKVGEDSKGNLNLPEGGEDSGYVSANSEYINKIKGALSK